MLSDFFSNERIDDEYDKTNRGYWLDSIAIVWVEWVKEITEDELNFIKNLERIPNESNKHTADTYILQHKELKNLYRFFKECLHHYITQTIAPNQDEVQFYVTQS